MLIPLHLERAFVAFVDANANAGKAKKQEPDRSVGAATGRPSDTVERHEQTEEPLSPTEAAKRKVQFRDDPRWRGAYVDGSTIDAEKRSCHLSSDDNDRMEWSQMTFMHWDNLKTVRWVDDNRRIVYGFD
jgi:hypothetical protein